MDTNVLAELITTALSSIKDNIWPLITAIITTLITADITGRYNVKAAREAAIATEKAKQDENSKSAKPLTPKFQLWQIIAIFAIGVATFFIMTALLKKTDLPGLKFGNPEHYIEIDGQDFGYDIFNLTALKYFPTTNMEPSEARTADQTAQIFSARNDYEQALIKHNEAIELEPDNDLFWYHKGVTLAYKAESETRAGDAIASTEDYKAAAEQFQKCIELKRNIAFYHASRGIVLVNLKSYEEASAEYQNAVNLHGNVAFYQCNLGFTLAIQGHYEDGYYENALKAYKKAVSIDSEVASYHYNLGVVYYQMEHYEDALLEIRRAVSLKSDVEHYHLIHGFILNHLERYEEALELFNKQIDHYNPDDTSNAIYHYALWKVYYSQLQNTANENRPKLRSKALSEIREAIRLDKNNAKYHYSLWSMLDAVGLHETALPEIQAAVSLEPDNAEYQSAFERTISRLEQNS